MQRARPQLDELVTDLELAPESRRDDLARLPRAHERRRDEMIDAARCERTRDVGGLTAAPLRETPLHLLREEAVQRVDVARLVGPKVHLPVSDPQESHAPSVQGGSTSGRAGRTTLEQRSERKPDRDAT